MGRLVADVAHLLSVQDIHQALRPENTRCSVGIHAADEVLQGRFAASTEDNNQAAERQVFLPTHKFLQEVVRTICVGILLTERDENPLAHNHFLSPCVRDDTRREIRVIRGVRRL
jgi:hypothetical protein